MHLRKETGEYKKHNNVYISFVENRKKGKTVEREY